MNDTQSTRRSIGDKLLILGAHYNAHPELPQSVNLTQEVVGAGWARMGNAYELGGAS